MPIIEEARFQKWEDIFRDTLKKKCSNKLCTLQDTIIILSNLCEGKEKNYELWVDRNRFDNLIGLGDRKNASLAVAFTRNTQTGENDQNALRTVLNWLNEYVDTEPDYYIYPKPILPNRKDSYRILIQCVFEHGYSQEQYEELFDILNIRRLYVLDCREAVFLLAIQYNQRHPESRISFGVAMDIAKKAPDVIIKTITDKAKEYEKEHKGCDQRYALSVAVRELYQTSKMEYKNNPSYNSQTMTQFTKYVTDRVIDTFAAEEAEEAFEKTVENFLRENAGAILKSRARYHSLITDALYGNYSNPNPSLKNSRCRWLDLTKMELTEPKEIKDAFSKKYNRLPKDFKTSVKNRLGFRYDIPNLALFFLHAYKTPNTSELYSILKDANALSSFADATRSFLLSGGTPSRAVAPPSRQEILAFCLLTGKIFRDEVNEFLDAAGEPPLNGCFKSDRELIAVDVLCDWWHNRFHKDEELSAADELAFYHDLLEAIRPICKDQNITNLFEILSLQLQVKPQED